MTIPEILAIAVTSIALVIGILSLIAVKGPPKTSKYPPKPVKPKLEHGWFSSTYCRYCRHIEDCYYSELMVWEDTCKRIDHGIKYD